MPRAPYSQGPCAKRRAPPAQVRAPHHVRSLQVLKAASALRQARLAGGGADDAVVPTSSATLARGLHRRVDPLAERQGALAAHAAGYASRQGLPQKYSPSSGIHTISHTTHESAPAVCIACCVPLHSGARRPACMQHKHAARRCRSSRCGQSQHRPASAWACGRVTTLVSG